MFKTTSLRVLIGLLVGCVDTNELSILGASAGPLVREAPQVTTAALRVSAADDSVPRRVYRASDMLLHACTTLDDGGAIVGKDCAGGFVVFGPYVSFPAGSEVQAVFEIESNGELVVASDIVSNMGRQRHGELGNQTVLPNAKRPLGYRVRLSEAAEAIEVRIFIRSGHPVSFKISDLEIAVQ